MNENVELRELIERIEEALKITQRDNHVDAMFVHQVMLACKAAARDQLLFIRESKQTLTTLHAALERKDAEVERLGRLNLQLNERLYGGLYDEDDEQDPLAYGKD